MKIDVTFEETNSTFYLNLIEEECKKNFDAGFDESVLIPTERDHAKLNNRDAADQHPMSAITGLTKQMSEKIDNEFLSNLEIQAILES